MYAEFVQWGEFGFKWLVASFFSPCPEITFVEWFCFILLPEIIIGPFYEGGGMKGFHCCNIHFIELLFIILQFNLLSNLRIDLLQVVLGSVPVTSSSVMMAAALTSLMPVMGRSTVLMGQMKLFARSVSERNLSIQALKK